MILITFPVCTEVKITMSNIALVSHGSYAGTYKISTYVNGQPSYTFDENAIWYTDNFWYIGQISDIGKFGFTLEVCIGIIQKNSTKRKTIL